VSPGSGFPQAGDRELRLFEGQIITFVLVAVLREGAAFTTSDTNLVTSTTFLAGNSEVRRREGTGAQS